MSEPSHLYIAFNPVAFSLGPLQVHWYGIMYLLAFLFFWAAGAWTVRQRPWWGWSVQDVGDMLFYGMLGVVIGGRVGYVLFYALDAFLANPLFLFFWAAGAWTVRQRPWWGWSVQDVGDMLFYGMLGVVIGGRVGYVLFYAFDAFLANPLFLFRITQGGMSFHGGLLGVIAAMAWFARRSGRGFWRVADFVAPLVPIGLALGRLGNFIGGELWGRLSDAPWAMVFANAIEPGGWQSERLREAWASGALDHLARHPSQLYQAAGEGLALFIVLAIYARKPRPAAAVSGLFLAGYGVFRFVAEFFREPDAHIGYLAGGWLTMGMVFSLPMVLAGVVMMAIAYARDSR